MKGEDFDNYLWLRCHLWEELINFLEELGFEECSEFDGFGE